MTDAFTRFVDASLHLPTLGFSLDWSRAGLTRADLATLESRCDAALSAMAALEAGAIANPDENRRVGHYWLRAPELAPEAALREAIEGTIAEVEQLASDLRAGVLAPPTRARFRQVIVVGIGGSALGPQLVIDALARPGADALAVHFADNTDPAGFDRLFARLDGVLGETLVVVISKSGGTKETRNGMLEVANAYRLAGLDFGQHAIAVTQEGSELDRHASASGFRARLPMWDWVGGRTSVTSAVGLLPAALAGVDVRWLLEGAREMDRATRVRALFENPAALLACVWHALGDGRGRRAMVMLPYKDALELSSRYLQQLVMESLGKREDRSGEVVSQGLTVYGNKGSTDQHAYVQQLLDGPDDFFATFVEVLKDRAGTSLEVEPGVTSGDYLSAFLQGTRRALAARGKPSLTLTFAVVDARMLGAFIALYERAVGLYAELIKINAYHQPAVESGKRAAAEILALQGRALAVLPSTEPEALTARQVAASLGSDDVDGLFVALRHLAANGRIGATPERDPAAVRFHRPSAG
ncbi:MAG: glucose-6-phosphate isomerase [Deltaproteobacteria bacterium]|nr:glucose-6-phosphate isomerase [Deltaproteobacteria bacterium]